MFKHQVIGIRRGDTWHSRESEHIVGLCTMEAVDADGRFRNFDAGEDWRVVRGNVVTEPGGKPFDGLTPACRFWSLDDVLAAMQRSTPRHEFYTREPKKGQRKIPVFSYLGNSTDLFTRDKEGKKVPVYVDANGGSLFTKAEGQRIPFRARRGSLFVRNPRTGECRDVERRSGVLIAIDADGSEEEVECRGGDQCWVKTRGDDEVPGNLHSLPETPVDCPQMRCTVIPRASRPVSRGYGSDGD